MKLFSFLILAGVTLMAGCNDVREDQIKAKETALSQKEFELILKEQLLDIRQERLEKAGIDMRLVTGTDTAFVNKAITGLWLVEQTCTKTDCDSSVVGDRKSEQWEFFYKDNLLIARAMAKDKLVRYYIGNYNDDIIELAYDRKEGTAEHPATKIMVNLKQTGDNRLEGQREIRRSGCVMIYTLTLKKQ